MVLLLDTCILIDYFRKTNKDNAVLYKFLNQEYSFAISAVTKYEIYTGVSAKQSEVWEKISKMIATVIPVDEAAADTAVVIYNNLKKKSQQIGLADLFIAATAINHKLPIVTINKKHFERVEKLKIME